MRSVDRVQAGIDRVQRYQGPHSQVRHGPVRVGLGLHGLRCRHRRALGARGQCDDGRGRADVFQSPERDHGLRRTRGEGSASAARNGAGSTPFSSRLAIGQRPERELADGLVSRELAQGAVRLDTVDLLEREERRDSPVQGARRVGREIGEGSGRLRRRDRGAGSRAGSGSVRPRWGRISRRSVRPGQAPSDPRVRAGSSPGAPRTPGSRPAVRRRRPPRRRASSPRRAGRPRRCPCRSAGGW